MKVFYGQTSAQGVNLLVQNQLIRKRIIFDIFLLSAVFYAPWWVVVPIACIAAFLFPPYYEIIAWGVLVDILYGAHTFSFGGMFGVLTAIVILFVASYVKKIVR